MRDRTRQLGQRAYLLAHAHVGDCTHPSLAESAALAACPLDVDREAWLAGWRGARDEHVLERSRYLVRAWIPLPGL